MSLSCSCEFDGAEAGEWYWEGCSEPEPMRFFPRRKRCCSCGSLINTGEIATEFYRYMATDECSVTGMIHGERYPMGSWYECEECNDLRENLEELGYCVNLGDDTRELTREYAAMQKELRSGEGQW